MSCWRRRLPVALLICRKAMRSALEQAAWSANGTVYLVLDPLGVEAFNPADGWMRDHERTPQQARALRHLYARRNLVKSRDSRSQNSAQCSWAETYCNSARLHILAT